MTAKDSPEAPVAAHEQSCTNHYTVHIPEHLAREDDPHYAVFDAARRRLMRTGQARCWICGTPEQLELHHDEVEFCLAGAMDWQKFAFDFPDAHLSSEEEFLAFIEGPSAMRVLCKRHHTGAFTGIHSVPFPTWKAQRWVKDGYELLLDPGGARVEAPAGASPGPRVTEAAP